jgi:branched-chain amino acid transport system ATP-binding protein
MSSTSTWESELTGPIFSGVGLCSGYGSNVVLRNAEFALAPLEICGIIGPNGAGKTTLLRTLFGLLPLRSGRIDLDGEDMSARPLNERLRRGVSYVPQERNVFPNLTVIENLEMTVDAHPDGARRLQFRDRLDYVFDLFPRLAERGAQSVGSMSGGEQRMVAIAIGLMSRPRILMLDEPTTGLAPHIVHLLMSTVAKLNENERISIVIVEQNIVSMLKIVHKLFLVKDGKSAPYAGRPETLAKQQIWEYL